MPVKRKAMAGLLIILAGFAAIYLSSRQSGGAVAGVVDSVVGGAQSVATAAESVAAVAWQVPRNGVRYWGTITDAANSWGVPPILLARLLWQESHFRDDIINGSVRSPRGATGIAQFMPATAAELGVDPLDPYASIRGAAQYLARLKARFGNWRDALAAYNWGEGNVARKGFAAAPPETVAYVTDILADVGIST
jgi:soluble lytic murein transglycosylase-like protein